MYRITTTDGSLTQRQPDERFEDFDAAYNALGKHEGWDEPAISGWYAVDGGEGCSVYATEEEMEADEEGAYAPRILKLTIDQSL